MSKKRYSQSQLKARANRALARKQALTFRRAYNNLDARDKERFDKIVKTGLDNLEEKRRQKSEAKKKKR